MKKKLVILLSICGLFLFSLQANAYAKTYVVAPFQVNGPKEYAYLKDAIPSMLASRLFWSGHYETSSKQDSLLKSPAPTSRSAAQSLLTKSQADYIFYGTATALGNEISIDVTALSKDGKQWQSAINAKKDTLISELQVIANKLSAEVFGKSQQAKEFVGQISPSGQFTNSGNFINPSIAYETAAGQRMRSKALEYTAVSMELADINNDGVDDIILGDEARSIYGYSWNKGSMFTLFEHKLGSGQRILAVRSITHNGKPLIVVSAFSETDQKPLGFVYEIEGKALKPILSRLPLYLNTITLPNSKQKKLIAQSFSDRKPFHGAIFELVINGNKYEKGSTLTGLPSQATIFNFNYLPTSSHNTTINNNIVLLGAREHLEVYSKSGKRLFQTSETYSGGGAYIRTYNGSMKGRDNGGDLTFLYIPLRIIVSDFNKDSIYEIISNHPISTAAALFKNFRNFAQGQIEAFNWDGASLNQLWTTRKINGTVADYQIGDPNNDGITDLVVTLVTYPGALGIGERKTFITIYPLSENTMLAPK